MATMMLTRMIAGEAMSLHRAGAVTSRNLAVLGSSRSYWWVLTAAFVEPLLYLLAIGWGVGALVGDITLADGRSVPYLTFLAPALLAASAMNGAIAEAALNFFMKVRYTRQFDAVLNTPVTPPEVALGELGWATIRGGLYSAAFLAVTLAMGLTTPLLALATLPAALLLGLAIGSLGLALATFMRHWQDFEYVTAVQMALFLFSGTFVPVSAYPIVLQVIVPLTPLYHGVELVRGLMLEQFSWSMLGNAGYLVALTIVGLLVAGRRTARILRS